MKESVEVAVKEAVQSTNKEELTKLVKDSFAKGLKHIQDGMGLAFAFASEAADKENRQEEALKIHQNKIFENQNHPFWGASQAKKLAIIFTDPYCSHCHQSFDEFEKYVQKAPDVKLIIPIRFLGRILEWQQKPFWQHIYKRNTSLFIKLSGKRFQKNPKRF